MRYCCRIGLYEKKMYCQGQLKMIWIINSILTSYVSLFFIQISVIYLFSVLCIHSIPCLQKSTYFSMEVSVWGILQNSTLNTHKYIKSHYIVYQQQFHFIMLNPAIIRTNSSFNLDFNAWLVCFLLSLWS